jgi:threonine/homoserine/homoserine lactone efflux protein
VNLSTFLTGGVVGFCIAAPVGPIGALTIRRTLALGRVTGFVTGLGAATADAAYGAIAAFGLTFITGFLVAQQGWLRCVGGIFLLYIGITTFRAPPAPPNPEQRVAGLLSAYATTVFLTLSNPTTILSFLGIFAALGLQEATSNYVGASVFVLGVFLGSTLWWLILSSGVGLLRPRITDAALHWVNKFSGALVAAFGIYALAGLF